MNRARRLERVGYRVIAARPARARRDHERVGIISTKDGQEWACFDVLEPTQLLDCAARVASEGGKCVFWLDEAMLFPTNNPMESDSVVYTVVSEIRTLMPVMVSGLVQTSEQQPFGTAMPLLAAAADRVYTCKADCDECGAMDAATRSWHRTGKSSVVEVGGAEAYAAVCVPCNHRLWRERGEQHERGGEPAG